jgi:hypothetical protein
MKLLADHPCGFQSTRSNTDLIFCIRQVLEKKWEYNEAVHQLFIDFKKAYDSVRREVLYNILIEFGVSMKLVRIIKIHIGRHMPDSFPKQNGVKQGDALSPLPFHFALEYAIRKVQKNQAAETKWDTSAPGSY